MTPHPFDQVRRWHVLAGFVAHFGLQTVAEVGCKEGRTTGFLLEACPDVFVTAIDPWMPMPDHAGREGGETYEDWDFAAIEAQFKANTEKHATRVRQMRMTSNAAARHAAASDWQFDLVFIDAAHDYENVRADIAAWLPLVRPGGIIAGHDYQHRFPGVMRAVAESFCLFDVGVAPDSVWWVAVPGRELSRAA